MRGRDSCVLKNIYSVLLCLGIARKYLYSLAARLTHRATVRILLHGQPYSPQVDGMVGWDEAVSLAVSPWGCSRKCPSPRRPGGRGGVLLSPLTPAGKPHAEK